MNSTTHPREGCLRELQYHCIKIATERKATLPIVKTMMINEIDSVGHVMMMTQKILANTTANLQEENTVPQDESTDTDGMRKSLALV
jgi:hypothetical protein